MEQREIDVIINALSDELLESEIAAVITALQTGELEFFEVFDNNSIEDLIAGEEPEVIVKVKLLPKLDITEGTNVDFIEVKDGINNKFDYVVADDYDDAVICAKNSIIEYANLNGLENFDVDITQFVEIDFFDDWYRNKLIIEANTLLDKPSEIFENDLIEYLYENNELNEFDFVSNEDGEIDFKQCNVEDDLLIDLYITYNDLDRNELIQKYIREEGIQTFEDKLNKEIDIDWEALTDECIENDGVERYLSIDNSVNVVNINEVDYLVYLEHTNRKI